MSDYRPGRYLEFADTEPTRPPFHVQLHTVHATVMATPTRDGDYRITHGGVLMGYIQGGNDSYRAYKLNSGTPIVPPGGKGVWWTLEAAATALWKSIY